MQCEVYLPLFNKAVMRLPPRIKKGDGAVVRALASHRCGPGSIPGSGVTCGLSLLLVLVPDPRVFLRVLRFSSLHKNLYSKFQFDPDMRATGLSALLLSVTLTK